MGIKKIERKVNRIRLALSGLDEWPDEIALRLLARVVNVNQTLALTSLKAFKVWMTTAVLPHEIEKTIDPLVYEIETILTPKPKKIQPKIKPRSEKRAKQEKLYKKLHDEFLRRNRQCVRCRGRSEQVHHMRGRVGELLTDVTNFLPVCDRCHKWIESNPKESKRIGFSASKIGKNAV